MSQCAKALCMCEEIHLNLCSDFPKMIASSVEVHVHVGLAEVDVSSASLGSRLLKELVHVRSEVHSITK